MSSLDLLTANDEIGVYPRSQYAAGKSPSPRAALEEDISAEIVIIGAGFTGLNAALTLARAGKDVVVLEASRIGFGASGRNGGQIHIGQRQDQHFLEKLMGKQDAKSLFELGVEATKYVMGFAEQFDIGLVRGHAHTVFGKKEMRAEHDYAHYLREEYGYDEISTLDRDAMFEEVASPAYHGGVIYQGAGHCDPLALAFGVAGLAEEVGARIFECSRVVSLEPLATEHAKIKADQVILACNGYLGNLHPPTAKFVMPINNFIIATKPLGERARELIPNNYSVSDSKFVVNYFRHSPDQRLLFGGGESYGYQFPKDIKGKAEKAMLQIFPKLAGTPIDYAWGGTLGITFHRMPYLAHQGKLWVAAGYSGQGVALASFYGHALGRAILGDDADFALAASLPHRPFPGGAKSRHALLVAAMLYYQMRDQFK